MARKAKPKKKRGPAPRSIQPSLWVAIGLFALASGLYLNTLGHGFVFDDETLIAQNLQITQLQWSDILTGRSYRPVRSLTYALNYWAGGLDPFGYHLVNIVLHGLNSVLVYLLLLRLSESSLAATVGGLFFCAHPVQTAAVAYISGRKDLLATFFLLLGLKLYLSYRQRKGNTRLILSIAAFFLAVLSKEVAIVFPALLVLIDLRRAHGQGMRGSESESAPSPLRILWSALRKAPLAYALSGLLAVLAFWFAVFLAEASRMQGLWGGSLQNHIGTSFKLFAHYLRLTLFPYPLLADYTGKVFPVSKGLLEWSTLLSLALMVAYLLLAFGLRRRHPEASLGMLWFLICLLPVLQLIPFHEIAADHFLYLPLVGAALTAGQGVAYLVSEKKLAVPVWWLFASVLVVFSAMTIDRNRDWKDKKTLWEATYRMAPDSYRANANLGVIYHQERDLKRALEFTQRSIELNPDKAISYSNLGGLYRERAHQLLSEEHPVQARQLALLAIENSEKAIEMNPRDPFAHSNLGDGYKELGLIWDRLGDAAKARSARLKAFESFQKAVEIGSQNPAFPLVWYKLGMLLVDHGRATGESAYFEQAARHLENVVDAFPGFADAQYWMGFCQFRKGDYRKSILYLERVVALEKANREVYLLLARSYEELGETGRSLEWLQTAAGLFPDSSEVHYNLGVLYHRIGNGEAAARHLARALALDPEASWAGTARRLQGELKRESPAEGKTVP